MQTTRSNQKDIDKMSVVPKPQEHQEEEEGMAKVEEVPVVAFFLCPSQAYKGLINY
jgi:hypothetical protein